MRRRLSPNFAPTQSHVHSRRKHFDRGIFCFAHVRNFFASPEAMQLKRKLILGCIKLFGLQLWDMERDLNDISPVHTFEKHYLRLNKLLFRADCCKGETHRQMKFENDFKIYLFLQNVISSGTELIISVSLEVRRRGVVFFCSRIMNLTVTSCQ